MKINVVMYHTKLKSKVDVVIYYTEFNEKNMQIMIKKCKELIGTGRSEA